MFLGLASMSSISFPLLSPSEFYLPQTRSWFPLNNRCLIIPFPSVSRRQTRGLNDLLIFPLCQDLTNILGGPVWSVQFGVFVRFGVWLSGRTLSQPVSTPPSHPAGRPNRPTNLTTNFNFTPTNRPTNCPTNRRVYIRESRFFAPARPALDRKRVQNPDDF